MSPRFRRYLLRSLPALLLVLAVFCVGNRFFGGFSYGLAVGLWVMILAAKWGVRTELDRCE